MASQQRIALVIGNSKYEHGPLPNPVKDAALITARLRLLDFDIVGGVVGDGADKNASPGANLQFMEMDLLFAQFLAKVEEGGTALIYYAGHGLQVADQNCLVPVDDSLSDQVKDLGLIKIREKIASIIGKLKGSGTLIVLLDACRNDPLGQDQRLKLLGFLDRSEQQEFGQRGPAALARGSFTTFKMPPRENCGRTFIGFATAPGDVAMDGKEGNSAFARALDSHLAVRGLEIEELFDRVSLDVLDEVAINYKDKVQDPWSESNLNRQFFVHQRNGLPIVALALGGLIAGLIICSLIFDKGHLRNPAPWWAWWLGLVFGVVAAGGTYQWGSGCKPRDIALAFVGPGIGFALALAVLQIVPAFPSDVQARELSGSREEAAHIYWIVTLIGGALYLAGTFFVRLERKQPWPSTWLGWLNWSLTWSLPIIIVAVLLRLQFYMAAANPLWTALAMFALLGGVIYATSIALACRAQGGIFSQFGPFTGAITVGLLMAAFFAFFHAIGSRRGIEQIDRNWLLVALGTAWHGLLGAQLGYCFTYYVPDHRRIRR